jgi:hypothetical protein
MKKKLQILFVLVVMLSFPVLLTIALTLRLIEMLTAP